MLMKKKLSILLLCASAIIVPSCGKTSDAGAKSVDKPLNINVSAADTEDLMDMSPENTYKIWNTAIEKANVYVRGKNIGSSISSKPSGTQYKGLSLDETMNPNELQTIIISSCEETWCSKELGSVLPAASEVVTAEDTGLKSSQEIYNEILTLIDADDPVTSSEGNGETGETAADSGKWYKCLLTPTTGDSASQTILLELMLKKNDVTSYNLAYKVTEQTVDGVAIELTDEDKAVERLVVSEKYHAEKINNTNYVGEDSANSTFSFIYSIVSFESLSFTSAAGDSFRCNLTNDTEVLSSGSERCYEDLLCLR